MRKRRAAITSPLVMGAIVLVVIVIAVLGSILLRGRSEQPWSEQEIALLRSLSLAQLPPPPPDPSNRFADDPRAAAFGQKLFFDARLSSTDTIACATCHQPERTFTDGQQFSTGVGSTGRSAPSVLGAAHSRWLFWDGRKDSLWAQALGPLESPVEHGGARTGYVKVIAQYHKDEYESIFGSLPADFLDDSRFPAGAGPVPDPQASAAWAAMALEDREAVTEVYVNIGKAIAAYERLIKPGQARFDMYVQALLAGNQEQMRQAMSAQEIAGARLFIGKARCSTCHSGPLLTDNGFHNINVPDPPGAAPDPGRLAGIKQVLEDEFNCLSKWSDALPEDCAHLERLRTADTMGMEGAFRTLTLRNIAETAPYMHAGQLGTLREVMEHYNTGIPGSELNLTEREIEQLVAFMHTLSAEVQQPPR